jgi:peroxiredoxin
MRRSVQVILALILGAGQLLAQGSNLVFKSTDGRAVDLANERGRVIVLSFSATWAPLAARELAALQKLADTYTGRPVSVYWVSINSTKQGAKNYAADGDLQAYASRNGFRGVVLRDPEQAAYKSLGLNSVPTIVVLDKNGTVARKHVGFDPDRDDALSDVTQAIDQALK